MERDEYDSETASSDEQDISPSPSSNSPDPETLKDELLLCLEDIEARGDFAAFGALEHIVDPGVHIKTVDGIDHAIKIPLNEGGARALAAESHQAPFGRRDQTIVDTSIRRTWELNSDQFELRNPAWQEYVAGILARVSKGLGISFGAGGLGAQLYKMLLYEKGAMFKAHTDTEKTPGMFGTLVVCLPSRHTGGTVILQQRGEVKLFSSADAEQSYICWYSDVSHEVSQVTSGYRWVLTYNLINTNPSPTANAGSLGFVRAQQLAAVTTALNQWRKALKKGFPHEHLIYLLRHQYTEASLRLGTLKGRDAVVGQHLEEACAATGFRLYLANLEQMVSGGAVDEGYDHSRYNRYYYEDYDNSPQKAAGGFHEIDDEFDREVKLKHIVDLGGEKIGEDMAVDEENILQNDPFDRDPDEEAYEGFTGNAGASATHWYRETVIVIMPKENAVEFLIAPFETTSRSTHLYGLANKSSLKLEDVMDHFIQKFICNPSVEAHQYDLLQACEFIIKYNTARVEGFPDAVLERVVRASCLLRRPDMFVRAVFCVKGQLPGKLFLEVGPLLREYGFQPLKEGLDRAVAGMISIHKRITAIQNIRVSAAHGSNHEEREIQSTLWEWGLPKIDEVCRDAKVCSKDGVALVDIVAWQWKQQASVDVLHRFLPFVKQHIRSAPFTISFLSTMLIAAETELIPKEVASETFKDVFRALLPVLSLCHEPESKEEDDEVIEERTKDERRQIQGGTAARKVRKAPISGQALARLLDGCIKLGLDSELRDFVNIVRVGASSIDPRDFRTMLLPFLRDAVTVLKKHGISFIEEPLYRELYRITIILFVMRYVSKEPEQLGSWAREAVYCHCRDCRKLNAFLLSPTQQIEYFPVDKGRRHHLHQQLNDGDCKHETRRDTYPETLVVTKSKNIWQKQFEGWQQRAQVAKHEMFSLGTELLKGVLGDSYEDVTTLYIVTPSLKTVPALSTPLATVAPTLQNPRPDPRFSWPTSEVSGPKSVVLKRKRSEVDTSKRKKPASDVIDLTGEDSGKE